MPRAPNRHTIMSHGGKHGTGGTYLKGSSIPPQVVEHVPPNLTHDAAAPGVHGVKHPKHPGAPALLADLSQTDKFKAAKKAPPSPSEPTKATEPAPESPPEAEPPREPESDPLPDGPVEPEPPAVHETEPVPPEPEDGEVTIPTTKRQLTRLPKEDCHALALELGLSVPEDIDDITVKDLRRLLAPAIGLE